MKGRGVKTKVAGVTLVITSFLGKREGEREGGECRALLLVSHTSSTEERTSHTHTHKDGY